MRSLNSLPQSDHLWSILDHGKSTAINQAFIDKVLDVTQNPVLTIWVLDKILLVLHYLVK
jgi:hypothetical protein